MNREKEIEAIFSTIDTDSEVCGEECEPTQEVNKVSVDDILDRLETLVSRLEAISEKGAKMIADEPKPVKKSARFVPDDDDLEVVADDEDDSDDYEIVSGDDDDEDIDERRGLRRRDNNCRGSRSECRESLRYRNRYSRR